VREVLARTLAEELPKGWPEEMDADNRFKVAIALNRWYAFILGTHHDRAHAVMVVA
jgi:hypothetical protein